MTDELENTADSLQNKPRGKQFTKGFDPRRNIKGVPKDAVLMRKHMRKIAAELIGGDESAMTRLDACLRQLWTSRNPAHNKLALQVLDPKILIDNVDVTSGGKELPQPKDDNARFDRAISTLADAVREIVSGKSDGQNSEVDTAK